MIINNSDPRIKMYAKMYGIDLYEAKKILEHKEEEKKLISKSNNTTNFISKNEESLAILDAQSNMNMYLIHKNKNDINNKII